MPSKERVLEISDVINGVTYYKCYIWVCQVTVAEAIQNKITCGKAELSACRGKREMPLGS